MNRFTNVSSFKITERDCKPDSVEGGHLSGESVSALLKRPTRGYGRATHPCSALLRVGVTEPSGHPDAGELLPHLFTLALFGRFEVSVALSEDRSSWVLPSTLPCGVRTFLEPIRPATTHPSPWSQT